MNTVRTILQVKGQQVWTISPDVSVFDAVRRMAEKKIGALLVMQEEKLVGIISERDYARKIILNGKASKDTQVKEIMTGDLIIIHPDQTVHECMQIMNENSIRHLPVVEDGKVIGIISIRDVLNDIIFQQKESIKNLEQKVLSKK